MNCVQENSTFSTISTIWRKSAVLKRYQYALSVLEKPMDFTGNDTYNLDRSKAPWPKNEAELNALWDSKVKFDELSLKLAGKRIKKFVKP